MLKKKSGGFTLIEITIVMAITATIAALILAGQGAVRRQSQFTTTVDNAVAKIEAVRNASMTNDNNGEAASKSGTDFTIYSRIVTAIPGTNYLTVSDVVGNLLGANTQTSVMCTGQGGGVVAANNEQLSMGTVTSTIPLNYGVIVGPQSALASPSTNTVQIGFHRTICNGYMTVTNLGTVASNVTTLKKYTENPTLSDSPTITLLDRQGNTAVITVNGLQQGAVTVQYK